MEVIIFPLTLLCSSMFNLIIIIILFHQNQIVNITLFWLHGTITNYLSMGLYLVFIRDKWQFHKHSAWAIITMDFNGAFIEYS